MEMPAVFIDNGPALLSSMYVPALMKIVTGVDALAILLARVIALARLAYGKSKDPSPEVSLPYCVT